MEVAEYRFVKDGLIFQTSFLIWAKDQPGYLLIVLTMMVIIVQKIAGGLLLPNKIQTKEEKMPRIISVKINVSLIDKAKLFKGEKGTYLDCLLLENEDEKDNQYGNRFMVVQSVSKEERLAGKRGAILGNAKYLVKKAAEAKPEPTKETEPQDDVPF